jgi:hypothetical protein
MSDGQELSPLHPAASSPSSSTNIRVYKTVSGSGTAASSGETYSPSHRTSAGDSMIANSVESDGRWASASSSASANANAANVELGHTSGKTTNRTPSGHKLHEQADQLREWSKRGRQQSRDANNYDWGTGSVIRHRSANGRGQDTLRGFNTTRTQRSDYRSRDGWVFWNADWFHTVVEMNVYKIFLFLILYYVGVIFVFSLLWLWIGSNGDPCNSGIANFEDAFYFSLITFTTIGFGAGSVFFNSCWSVSIIIIFESFVSALFNSLTLGIFFGKFQRGATRGISVQFSKNALIRVINGSPHLMFRVVEARKLQLVEAHVRVYAIYHTRGGHKDEVQLFQHRPLRINQPDDQLGGMLLLMLPTLVTHQVDPWSPLMPPGCMATNSKSMNSYAFPDVFQRANDAEQGQFTFVECDISGEGFSTEEAHRRHHQNEGYVYPCSSTPEVMGVEKIMGSLKEYFESCEMELLVLVEGIDPTMSATLQAVYSYKVEDILFDTHDFVPCVFRDLPYDGGRPKIDFAKFHEVELMDKAVSSEPKDTEV